jgi:hypothetical protein
MEHPMSDPQPDLAGGSPILNVRPASTADEDVESLGGDPPCWAHLFEDDDDPTTAPESRER